jgi:Ethanolamine utilization protein EutJ (predicted chaperonin)
MNFVLSQFLILLKGSAAMYLGLDLGTSSLKALLIDENQPSWARPVRH